MHISKKNRLCRDVRYTVCGLLHRKGKNDPTLMCNHVASCHVVPQSSSILLSDRYQNRQHINFYMVDCELSAHFRVVMAANLRCDVDGLRMHGAGLKLSRCLKLFFFDLGRDSRGGY